MEPISIPLAASWNLISSTAATPNGGLLYIGFKSVNYISAIKDDENPIIKAIATRQRIKSIDCDPDWSDTKYFAALADDNTIQIWDVNDSKAKKGHKAHIKTAIGDGDSPPSDSVAMCFMPNRTVLSIDSSCIVKYCIESNRYTKTKRIIGHKYKVSILKGSLDDDNIVAIGTTRGLIFLVNLLTETIMFTFCGHNREITSLSWTLQPIEQRPIKTPRRKLSRNHSNKSVTADDMFDIYDFDYLENEFGAPSRSAIELDTMESSAQKDELNNENFNFIEACRNLKDDILALKEDDRGNQSNSCDAGREGGDREGGDREGGDRQVTLNDCQQAIDDRADAAATGDCGSELSVEFPDSSNDSLADDFQNSCAIDSSKQQQVGKSVSQKGIMFLASGSIDGNVWIWNTKTGESFDQISLKGSHGQQANNFVHVSWLNPKTLAMNDKSCELAVYKVSSNPIEAKPKFVKEKRETVQRAIVDICKMLNSEIVWTISSHRELVCEDIANNKILAKFSCAITSISAIRENPNDMNRIAIAFPDRRVALMSLGSVTPKNIPMDYFTLREDLQIASLAWCPDGRNLAFATAEGRVGVIDTEKTSNAIVLMKPFSGKQIYSLAWFGSKIFACGQEKLAYYEWNGKPQHATKLNGIVNASSIAIRENCLIVGTQNGDVSLYRCSENTVDFKLISTRKVSRKYITEISLNSLNPLLVAVSSLSANVTVLKLNESELEVDRVLTTSSESASGDAWVKWSNKNAELLLSCGFDGVIRIWDLSRPQQDELVMQKPFDSPMFCGIFSPINEDIVICAGRATSIEMFNYKMEVVSPVSKNIAGKKHKDKPLGSVVWGTRLENAPTTKVKKNKRKPAVVEVKTETEENAEMIERLRQIKGDEVTIAAADNGEIVSMNPPTILHLIAKEFNKDTLYNIVRVLDDSVEPKLISQKLFGTREEVEEILHTEMKNHESSSTKSIGRIMIPQIGGNLKDEILECIRTKKLNEFHVSLAPSISYDFWRNCCKAYANQLFEIGLVLPAASYLLACHEIRDCLSFLMEKHFYREAWIIAKSYLDNQDPILDVLLKSWIGFTFTTGNYEAAAFLHVLTGNFKEALKCLLERRQLSDDHRKIIELLEQQTSPIVCD